MRSRFSLLLLLIPALAAWAGEVRVLVQSSPLAGFQYHAGADVWDQLKAGDALALVREPANARDANAVRVEWRGRQLGYLPRVENRVVAAELDRGAAVEARIGSLIEARNPWQRVRIDVYIKL